MNLTPLARSGLARVKSSNELNGLSLAYLGDAVIELLARKRVLALGYTDVGKLNALAREYITARAQSAALDRLLPALSEAETELYKRGRNAKGVSAPKSASVGEYRRATGMEALFGALYIDGQNDRIQELFEIAYPEEHT